MCCFSSSFSPSFSAPKCVSFITSEIFCGPPGKSVKPKEFFSLTLDQDLNVSNSGDAMGIPAVVWNAHWLNSATIWSLGSEGTDMTCKNSDVERPMKGWLPSRMSSVYRLWKTTRWIILRSLRTFTRCTTFSGETICGIQDAINSCFSAFFFCYLPFLL